jgi:hypothetical protein
MTTQEIKTNKIDLTIKANELKKKRLSKGWRLHVRRMKQEAGKAGTVYTPEYRQ